MPGSRESSVWRTLAVAFGDGLAFGVGLTLTNNATRSATSKTQGTNPDLHSMAERLSQVEQRLDRARFAPSGPPAAANTLQIAKVAEAVLTAMDGRFGELDAQGERRLAELEARIQFELDALDARARAAGQSAEAGLEARFAALRTELTAALEAQGIRAQSEVRVLRTQMLQVHKEFAETLARLVDEQIAHTITQRLQTIQEQTREAVREESERVCTEFGARVESGVDARLQALRDDRSALEREIADLHVRLDGDERSLFETIRTIGQSVMQAADRMPGPGAPRMSLSNGGGGSGLDTQISADGDLPGFARARAPGRRWRIPAVSGFLLAATGLVAIHYLVV